MSKCFNSYTYYSYILSVVDLNSLVSVTKLPILELIFQNSSLKDIVKGYFDSDYKVKVLQLAFGVLNQFSFIFLALLVDEHLASEVVSVCLSIYFINN